MSSKPKPKQSQEMGTSKAVARGRKITKESFGNRQKKCRRISTSITDWTLIGKGDEASVINVTEVSFHFFLKSASSAFLASFTLSSPLPSPFAPLRRK